MSAMSAITRGSVNVYYKPPNSVVLNRVCVVRKKNGLLTKAPQPLDALPTYTGYTRSKDGVLCGVVNIYAEYVRKATSHQQADYREPAKFTNNFTGVKRRQRLYVC